MSGRHIDEGLVCLWIRCEEGGQEFTANRRVITLHPVASVCLTKPDTGGQACQEQTAVTVISGNLQIHKHTHTLEQETHSIRVTGMCPRKAGMPAKKEEAAELIRAWIHTRRALTPHSPPACFLPVIVPP